MSADSAADLEIRLVGITHPDAKRLIEEVQAEYVARYGGRDESPIDASEFDGSAGQFFVGYLGERAVATAAWRRRDVPAFGAVRVGEIKRMYVTPPAQRRGFARVLLAHLEVSVAAAGLDVLILETGLRQPEAIALYESCGYVEIPGFGHYRESELNHCMGKRL